MLFIKFNYFYFISWDSNKKLCIFLITNKFFIFKWLIFKLLSYSNDIRMKNFMAIKKWFHIWKFVICIPCEYLMAKFHMKKVLKGNFWSRKKNYEDNGKKLLTLHAHMMFIIVNLWTDKASRATWIKKNEMRKYMSIFLEFNTWHHVEEGSKIAAHEIEKEEMLWIWWCNK